MVQYKNVRKMETKQRKRGFWTTKFLEFCKRTDLHGYKYIAMEDLSAVERACWSLTIIISIGVAASFVVTAYKWYARNPIVTVIESTQGAIWDVPFPAITICDLNMVSKKAATDLSKNLSLPEDVTSEMVLKSLQLTPLLHTPYSVSKHQKDRLQTLQRVLDHNNMTVQTMFQKISPGASCNKLIQRCMWKNTMYRCDHLFRPVFTILNHCCAFNYYAEGPSNKTKSNINQYSTQSPRRVASCGYQTALTVVLRIDPEDYFSASVASQGAMVIIDSAYNFPNQDSPARMVNPSTEVMIALSPERTYATNGIKSFTPELRQCYYNDEINIEGFEQYSIHNCMAAQKVRLLKHDCGCVPFYFPTKENEQTCNFNDMDCLESAYKSISESIKYKTSDLCLPECEHFDYLIEVAMGNLARDVNIKGLPFFKDLQLENRSLLNVFFNDLVSTRYRRDVYLNWQNILAAFGGLLSLMLGFTLISGFDLFLFFTVRVAYESCVESITRKMGRKEKSQVTDNNKMYVNNWIDKSDNNIIATNGNTKKPSYKLYDRYKKY